MLRAAMEELAGVDSPRAELTTILAEAHPTLGSLGTIRPGRREHWQDDLHHACQATEAVLLIAPETDGLLRAATRIVTTSRPSPPRLLGMSPAAVDLFADKWRTANALGPWSPATTLWPELPPTRTEEDATSWLVLKPRDGAGAMEVQVHSRGDAETHARVQSESGLTSQPSNRIVQPCISGLAGSFLILSDAAGHRVLPAGLQRIELSRAGQRQLGWRRHPKEGSLAYLGGKIPLSGISLLRLQPLAEAVIDAVGRPNGGAGYLGVDVLFGHDPSGAADRIVDVNPRLTTSFLAYRQLFPRQFGRWFLGNPDVSFSWNGRKRPAVRFRGDGTCY